MIQEAVVGVFVSLDKVLKELSRPHSGQRLLDHGQNKQSKKQGDSRVTFLLMDSRLAQQRLYPHLVHGFVDLGLHVEAMLLDFLLNRE